MCPENKLNIRKKFPEHLFYFARKENFESILKYGILSYNQVKKRKLDHSSFADVAVQKYRSETTIWLPNNGGQNLSIHDFVPLYFNSKTPTLFARKEDQKNLFFFKINSQKITTDRGVKFAFSDGNAANKKTNCFFDLEKLNQIDWKVINAKYWKDFEDGKRKRCAEFLIYEEIQLEFVDEVVLYDAQNYYTFQRLLSVYNKNIIINVDPKLFF
jgi:hypothetical protein